MGTSLMCSVLVLSGLALCSGRESIKANFHMNGITGTAILNWDTRNVAVVIKLLDTIGSGPVSVEIRPSFVDYSVNDKCSKAQLGDALPQFRKTVNFKYNAADVLFENVGNILSFEGYSILLNGSSKHVCTSIEPAHEVYVTAVARFQYLIRGTVYFRQSTSGDTRIVTDLYTNTKSYNTSWFISNTFHNCDSFSSSEQLAVFNPKNIKGIDCSTKSQEYCAVGQLSGKHGSVTVGKNKGDNTFGYSDMNLISIRDMNGMLLLIKTDAGTRVCAAIKVFSERKAVVEFNHDGVTGSVTFTQTSSLDPTTTSVDLKGLNARANGYHVHLWPTPTQILNGQDLCGAATVGGHFNPFYKNPTSPSYPAPNASTDDMYEVGDLSSKYGTLNNTSEIMKMYTDWNLPLYGSNSIIGRSLVIHRNDAAASRWVCANIDPYNYSVVVAIAVLKYPVIGQIMFMQGKNKATETSIFIKLDYNNGKPGTRRHVWGIGSNMVTDDMLSTDEISRCYSTGYIYDPLNAANSQPYKSYCNTNLPSGCQIGDLSGKHGFIDVRNPENSDTATRHFFTDMDLHLSGPYSIIGKSVFIMKEAGNRILACANIQRLHEPYLIANFSMGGVGGSISFRQNASFGATKTTVTNELTGLASNHRLFIYGLPPAPNSKCSNLGSVFNPLRVAENISSTVTDDKYMIGNLARYEINSIWDSYNLPLTGLASINQRSLVVVEQDSENKAVACTKIITAGSSPIVEAVSTFTGVVNGTIHFFQTINEDGTMSDTSILLDLKNQNDHQSENNPWHEHSNPVRGDAHAKQARCESSKGHMDPYMTKTNLTNYAIECRPENPLRCEMGDQSSKLGTYNIGERRKMYTDVDLPLAGKYSCLGRSMVIHIEGNEFIRLACADILPVISDTVIVDVNETSLDRLDIARVYAKAIMAQASDVVLELISESDGISKLKVHFVGFDRTANRNKFIAIINSDDQSSLAPYINIISDACCNTISTALFLAVFASQFLNYC